MSSGLNTDAQEDEAGLAAAVELLSCSFGTPRTGPVTLPADVPPVPPLPAQYLNTTIPTAVTIDSAYHGPASSTSGVREKNRRGSDVNMEDTDGSAIDDDEYDSRSRGRSDEDDDGVFGRMDEE